MLRRLLVGALLFALIVLSGCGTSPAHKAGWEARGDVGEIWGVGEQGVKSDLKQVDDGMSESHRMMAIMILSGAGEDTDLDSYERVFLADVATNDGANTATVVVVEEKDGKQRTVIPQAVRDQGKINE